MDKVRIHPFLLFLVFMLLLPVAGGCDSNGGTTGSSKAEPQAFSDEIQQKLNKVLDDQMAAANLPGAIVGIWAPGKGEWVTARGLADTETGRAIQLDDKVRIASNTKTFTATVILQLVDEDRLSLDDKLEQYVPGIAN